MGPRASVRVGVRACLRGSLCVCVCVCARVLVSHASQKSAPVCLREPPHTNFLPSNVCGFPMRAWSTTGSIQNRIAFGATYFRRRQTFPPSTAKRGRHRTQRPNAMGFVPPFRALPLGPHMALWWVARLYFRLDPPKQLVSFWLPLKTDQRGVRKEKADLCWTKLLCFPLPG